MHVNLLVFYVERRATMGSFEERVSEREKVLLERIDSDLGRLPEEFDVEFRRGFVRPGGDLDALDVEAE